MKVYKRQKGFVLVVVLCMILVMAAVLFTANRRCIINVQKADDTFISSQALCCASAGLDITISAIKNSYKNQTAGNLVQALKQKNHFDVETGSCRIDIQEEHGKININNLKDRQGQLNRPAIDQLLRLLDKLNTSNSLNSRISYELVPAIIDFTDPDSEVTYLPFIKNHNRGAESGFNGKTSYRCRNAPLNTIDELLMVRGITPEIFDLLKNHLTVYGSGKIDINQASAEVIETLSENMYPVTAEMIIRQRRFRPFENVAELKDVPGMTDRIYNDIKSAVTVEPAQKYFHVISKGLAGENTKTVEAVVTADGDSGKIHVLFYRET